MANLETRCPECGRGPVGEENCRFCGAIFGRVPALFGQKRNNELLSDFGELDAEPTNFSYQLPDTVSVRPLATAMTFAAAAAVFWAEGAGLPGTPRGQPFLFGLAGLDAVIAVGVLMRLGLLRALAYISIPVHVGVLLWIGRADPLTPAVVAGALFPLATLVGSVREPGAVRRVAGLGLCLLLLGGRAWSVHTQPAADESSLRLAALAGLGVTVEIPPGFATWTAESRGGGEVVPVPELGSETAAVALASMDFEVAVLVLAEPASGMATPDEALRGMRERTLKLLVARADEAPVDLAPGDFGKVQHQAVKLRSGYGGRDRVGTLLVARRADGVLVATATLVPSSMSGTLRVNSRKALVAVRFLDSEPAQVAEE